MRSCRTMRPPYSFFHAQARSRNFSRPMSSLEMPSALRASTTLISVAMEAWSVPGTQRVGSPLHAVVADKHILRHLIQRVAHVELAGDVRRRHDDGEGLFFRVDDRLEGPGRLPLFVDARFHILRRKYLVHLEFLHGFPSVRYKKPVRPKGGDRPRYHLYLPLAGPLCAIRGAPPADYFPSPARLGSDLRASAIRAALQPVDRPLLGSLRATPLRHRQI